MLLLTPTAHQIDRFPHTSRACTLSSQVNQTVNIIRRISVFRNLLPWFYSKLTGTLLTVCLNCFLRWLPPDFSHQKQSPLAIDLTLKLIWTGYPWTPEFPCSTIVSTCRWRCGSRALPELPIRPGTWPDWNLFAPDALARTTHFPVSNDTDEHDEKRIVGMHSNRLSPAYYLYVVFGIGHLYFIAKECLPSFIAQITSMMSLSNIGIFSKTIRINSILVLKLIFNQSSH